MKKSYKLSKKLIFQKLNLPIIKGPLPEPPILSMDEYLIFVEDLMNAGITAKVNPEEKKKSAVNVRFRLQ